MPSSWLLLLHVSLPQTNPFSPQLEKIFKGPVCESCIAVPRVEEMQQAYIVNKGGPCVVQIQASEQDDGMQHWDLSAHSATCMLHSCN